MKESLIDMHVHVGIVGDVWKNEGYMSASYRDSLVFKSFQLFSRLKDHEINDIDLHRKTCEVIMKAHSVQNVVCLALSPVYDNNGNRQTDLSDFWVSNDYVKRVYTDTKGKALMGVSVHPYDPNFNNEVDKWINEGAVLLKWLPSAQQIDLADPNVAAKLMYLAGKKNKSSGKPFPLLLHVGPEYAVPILNKSLSSYDYLSWTKRDDFTNFFRSGKNKLKVPNITAAIENLKAAVDAGLHIILAHCGLPYFAPNKFLQWFEHSDFDIVKELLHYKSNGRGAFYADVSACVTPFRKPYFKDIIKLPQEKLIMGSDFPVPVFELSADSAEHVKDFKAILKGETDRIVIPQDNLIEVNNRELHYAFGNALMFTNFSTHFL